MKFKIRVGGISGNRTGGWGHLERERGGGGRLFRKTYPTNASIKSKQLIITEGSNRFNFTRNFAYIEIVSLDFLGIQANKQ